MSSDQSAQLGSLPLRYRVPNPPVDRSARPVDREIARRVECARLTLLVGAEAKETSSALRTALVDHHSDQIGRVLYVDMASEPGEESLLTATTRALSTVVEADVEWRELRDNLREFAASVIDHADGVGAWIVIDRPDASHRLAEPEREMLRLIKSYARSSRWVVTAETRPSDPELAECTVDVPPSDMSTASEAEPGDGIGDVCAQPEPAEGDGSAPEAAAHRRERWHGEVLAQLVRVLRASDLALPRDLVESQIAPDELERAVDSGLLRFERGATLVAVGESRNDGEPVDERSIDAIVRLLVESDGTRGALFAAKLLRELGRTADLAALLSEHVESLLAHGYAEQLLSLLPDDPEGEFRKIRLRCAAIWRSPEALQSVTRPDDPTPRERLRWAEILNERGEVERARREAESLCDDDLDPAVTEEALLFLSTLPDDRRDGGGARRHLAHGAFEGPGREVRRQLRLAMEDIVELDEEKSRNRLRDIDESLQTFDASERVEVGLDLARVYFLGGDNERALAVLERLRETAQFPVSTYYSSDWAYRLEATIRVARADLDGAEAALESMSEWFRRGSRWATAGRNLEAVLARYRTGLATAEGMLADLLEDLRDGNPQAAQNVANGLARTRLRLYGAHRTPGPERFEAATPSDRRRRRQIEQLLRARSGEGDAEHDPLSERARACRLLLAGRPHEAASTLEARIRELRDEGDALRALDLERTWVELSASHGFSEAGRRVDDYRRRADAAGATALVRIADWYGALAEGDSPVSELVEWADRGEEFADIARISRDLLGADASLDAYERRLADVVRGRLDWIASPVEGPAAWEETWWVDRRERSVVIRYDGGTAEIDFGSRSIQFALLEALVDGGGALSKEQLLRRVWEIDEHHPFRHENRLRLAVHKIRNDLEPDGDEGFRRLRTRDDGYALGPGAVAIRAV